MPPWAAHLLAELTRTLPLLAQPVNARIWKVVRAAGKRGGIPALHPHALRHACGAELLRRTKNLRLVQEQLRHADVQTTTGYTKITQQDIRERLETLDNEGE